MKGLRKLLILFILTSSMEVYATEINYSIWFEPTHIKVELVTIGNKEGVTKIQLPLSFSRENYSENDNIQIYLDKKLFKKITKLNHTSEYEDYIICLKHISGAKIRIIYDLHNSA